MLTPTSNINHPWAMITLVDSSKGLQQLQRQTGFRQNFYWLHVANGCSGHEICCYALAATSGIGAPWMRINSYCYYDFLYPPTAPVSKYTRSYEFLTSVQLVAMTIHSRVSYKRLPRTDCSPLLPKRPLPS